VKELRRRARSHIEQGAVTAGYRADRETVVRVINEALATEIVCVLRYKRHYYMASGIHAQMVAQEFAEHAAEEQTHADQIVERIIQLGGAPDLNPDGLLSRSHSEYVEGEGLLEVIREDLVADPTTRRLMEEILAKGRGACRRHAVATRAARIGEGRRPVGSTKALFRNRIPCDGQP
jgi:bacterioferritin